MGKGFEPGPLSAASFSAISTTPESTEDLSEMTTNNDPNSASLPDNLYNPKACDK